MSAPLRIALIGAGNMGRNHARVIHESPAAELAVVVDTDAARAEALAERHGATAAVSLDAVRGVDAAIVAISTEKHVAVARELLAQGLPLLVEKPMALHTSEVSELCDLAASRGLPIMCGFVERFNAVIMAVASDLEGSVRHAISVRHSPHAPHVTTSVVWDLLIHDVDLALRLCGGDPVSVVSQAAVLPPLDLVEVADCSVRFGTGAITTHSASRAGQRKMRTWQIATETALYELDLLRQDVTVYRHISAELVFAQRPHYRAEASIEIPFVRHGGEPLALQLQHFVALLHGDVDIDAERATILPPHQVAEAVAHR
jgi:predicted dehydrogenase